MSRTPEDEAYDDHRHEIAFQQEVDDLLKPAPSDLDAKLAEMRELLDYAEKNDPSAGYIVILARQLIDTLQAIVEMPERTKCAPDDEETALTNWGYNTHRAEVLAKIAERLGKK